MRRFVKGGHGINMSTHESRHGSRHSGVVVIGGGIAGVQASLDLADAGIRVYLVERSPSLGGKMAQLDKTFPTNDCSMCILSPRLVAAARHPNITLFTLSEVTKTTGEQGKFTVTVVRHPRYVDEKKCVGCGECAKVCPQAAPNEFDLGLGTRHAIYTPFPQAVPVSYLIDRDICINKQNLIACNRCMKACERKCIDFSQMEETVELEVQAIIVATGADVLDSTILGQYGYGVYQNVVTSLELERMSNAGGPSEGHLVRPGDLKTPESILFIQCAGSRDEGRGCRYCSRVCCMYSLKQAIILKEHDEGIKKIDIVYMDMRAFGKGFQDYVKRAGQVVQFHRGKAAEVTETDTGNMIVTFEELDSGECTSIETEMVVLTSPLVPSSGNAELAKALDVERDEYGFFKEQPDAPFISSKPGIYLCGCATAPKDIPDSISQALGAVAGASSHVTVKVEQKEDDVKPLDVSGKPRIGVFVCHCGKNIAGVIDVRAVAKYAATLPDVVYSEDNLFTCSDISQKKIQETILNNRLNRVIVAACSPRTHEPIFRDSCAKIGLNPYLFEMVNIRDQCSWVHSRDPDRATGKAKDLIRMMAAKLETLEPLRQDEILVTKAALIIGGGIAGIEAAAALSSQNVDVFLVEKEDALGGRMNELTGVYPQDTAGKAVYESRLRQLEKSRNVRIMTATDVRDISGFVGNFRVRLYSRREKKEHEIDAGAIVLAMGADLYKPDGNDYGYGKFDSVITNLELERELGKGKIKIGEQEAGRIAFIQCVGARSDEDKTMSNCSRYCCSVAVHQAVELAGRGCDVTVLFRDIMTYGRGMEELYRKASGLGVRFMRFDRKPEFDGKRIRVLDRTMGEEVSVPADLLVLSVGLVPRADDYSRIQGMLKVPLGQDGFFLERHAKLGPLETNTDGIFLAGCCSSPKTINETISQAAGVAARVMTILSHDKIKLEPLICIVDEMKCRGCATCRDACRFNAISIVSEGGRKVSQINSALCKGCGTCAAECPTGAISARGFTHRQILDMITAFSGESEEKSKEAQGSV
jgi:heterodisulfide reductase subunit A